MIAPGSNTLDPISQIVNSLILGVAIILPFLISQDARRNRIPWIDTVAWACVSTFLFPVGLVLYCWLGRNRKDETND